MDHKSLPMLDIWPFYVQSIIKPCLHDAAARPNFRAVHSNLLAIKDSGEDLTSVVLDGASLTGWKKSMVLYIVRSAQIQDHHSQISVGPRIFMYCLGALRLQSIITRDAGARLSRQD